MIAPGDEPLSQELVHDLIRAARSAWAAWWKTFPEPRPVKSVSRVAFVDGYMTAITHQFKLLADDVRAGKIQFTTPDTEGAESPNE